MKIGDKINIKIPEDIRYQGNGEYFDGEIIGENKKTWIITGKAKDGWIRILIKKDRI